MTTVDDVTRRLLELALVEDTAGRDVTAAATVPADLRSRAQFVARAAGVVAGGEAVAEVLRLVDPQLRFTPLLRDGERITPGAVIAEVVGAARSILAAERTALNLLTHLSGVATQTARYVEAVAGTACLIRDTRKTLPGLRSLQKAAVAAGGGTNHRFSLSDGLLVKDNHVAAAGGVSGATAAALAAAGGLPVQIEVDNLAQLDQALQAGARSVLLDNFSLTDMADAVIVCRAVGERVFVEASGNVTLETVRAITETGVDAVAVGALTHSVRTLDIGLDWQDL